MIFKTIGEGDTAKVVTALQARKIAQEELNASLAKQAAALETDSVALKQLEINVAQGIPYEQAFAQSMTGASSAAKEHAIATKGAAGSTDVFVAKQKSAQAELKATATAAKGTSVAMKALSIAGNMLLMWAISEAISFAVKSIDNYVNRIEKLKEVAEEAKSTVDQIKSDFESLSSTTNDVKERYAELAQEVENLGKVNQSRGTLSTEDYEEFLDLSNQLADLFPQLTVNYDENGNAILNLSGNVNTIVGSLNNFVDVQQRLANQQIMEQMPDIWSGYQLDLENYNKQLSESEQNVDRYLQRMEDVRNRSSITLYDENANNLLIKAATQAGIMSSEYGNAYYNVDRMAADLGSSFNSATWDFSKLTDEEYDALLAKLAEFSSQYEDEVQITKGNIANANADLINYLNTWLSTEWNFSKMDSDMQTVAKDMLFNGDWVGMIPDTVDSNNWNAVSEWLQREILYEINKVQDNPEISKALSEVFTNADLTPNDKANYIKQIQDYFGEDNPISVMLQPQFEENEAVREQISNAIGRISNIFENGFSDAISESRKLLDFFNENSINTIEEIDYWNSVTEGAKNAEEAIRMYIKARNSITSTEFSLSDIFSLEDAENELTNLGKISESIDIIQNAYKTLNDAINEYNENGAFSIDTIQSVIALGDDWLDYLVDEEGHLQLDKESLENLTRSRLNDMRVQAINNLID